MSDETSKPEQPPAAEQELPRCRCGHTIESREVQLEPVYSGFGMFLFTMGITAHPKYAEYKCVRCRQVLGRTTDQKLLAKFD